MNIQVNTRNMALFKCLSSETRIKIIELLNEGSKNIGELAEILNVSSAIITKHISALKKCGIVQTESVPGKRGLQKICTLSEEEITLIFKNRMNTVIKNTVSIPVGQYTTYKVQPTCGLASVDSLIGVCDDPRYFSSPERFNASIIWFQSGWVEYCIPGYLISAKPISSIKISLEICSEYPNYKEDWPSDIYFYLNNILLGTWLSPGDFGNKKGTYTPQWWHLGTKYGLLKTIQITKTETKLDGIKLSEITLDHLSIKPGTDLIFRIAAPEDTDHPGGASIFGQGFGNYNQNIEVEVEYE